MTQERLHSGKVNAYDVSALDCLHTSTVCTCTLSKNKEVNKVMYSTIKTRLWLRESRRLGRDEKLYFDIQVTISC